jgi:RNA polymerase sigma-70 factor, ECF subfamily
MADSSETPLGELFEQYRDRLRRAVQLRLDPRLKGRIDPSDVIQEAYVEAQARFDDFRRDSGVSPFLWIRLITMQRLLILHRQHFQAKLRDVRREIPLEAAAGPAVSSFHLASMIIDTQPGPSQAASRAEQQRELERALDGIRPGDRDVLVLRHFEHLSNAEAAAVLGISVAAASRRYYRALQRLKEALRGLLSGPSE